MFDNNSVPKGAFVMGEYLYTLTDYNTWANEWLFVPDQEITDMGMERLFDFEGIHQGDRDELHPYIPFDFPFSADKATNLAMKRRVTELFLMHFFYDTVNAETPRQAIQKLWSFFNEYMPQYAKLLWQLSKDSDTLFITLDSGSTSNAQGDSNTVDHSDTETTYTDRTSFETDQTGTTNIKETDNQTTTTTTDNKGVSANTTTPQNEVDVDLTDVELGLDYADAVNKSHDQGTQTGTVTGDKNTDQNDSTKQTGWTADDSHTSTIMDGTSATVTTNDQTAHNLGRSGDLASQVQTFLDLNHSVLLELIDDAWAFDLWMAV